jgi:hypothetical protein
MLKEIRCTHFSHQVLSFHSGLNVILGDDDARNSIGKSTMLMVIDFALGGSTFLKDDAGAIRELGHHRYDFAFQFGAERWYFSRATDTDNIVQVCNEDYSTRGQLSLEEFNRLLKQLYGMDALEHSFRSVINPFGRIWKKGGLDPSHPFLAVPREAGAVAVGRLIDLFGRSPDVASERETLEKLSDLKKTINKSVAAHIIPNVTKTQYMANQVSITRNKRQIEQLRNGLGGALTAYESLFDESLRKQQQHKNMLADQRTELQNKIKRLEREISGITPRLAANIALVADFFPTVDVDRLQQVEAFHQKIGSIVKKELKDELTESRSREASLGAEMAIVEWDIQKALEAKGMPDDIFSRVLELKEEVDKASTENEHFEKQADIRKSMSLSSERLESIYSEIFLDIERNVNQKLRAFNKVVYGPSRASSALRIKSASSYQFTSPEDTGTGKSFADLVGFDLAMLSLTMLPLVLHDSIIYKNIEVPATRRILRILAGLKSKQVFLAFDEASKFGSEAEELLKRFTVVKLAHNDLLYTMDWRDKK